jgi:hypothetical protein
MLMWERRNACGVTRPDVSEFDDTARLGSTDRRRGRRDLVGRR